MIRHRFSVFRGVGPKLEQTIWKGGVLDWPGFLKSTRVSGLPAGLYRSVSRQICQWMNALERGDAAFFAKNLPLAEHWQLYKVFGDSVRYLDIETTGLIRGYNVVTMVGIYNGQKYQALIRGKGLTNSALQRALQGCKLIVTYYGRVFDVPFLRNAYPRVDWNYPHFDLCFAGRRLGLKGGLKGVEKSLGIERPGEIEHVDGFEAVRLWYRYTGGSKKALNHLIAYNEADTTNLAHIAPLVYDGLCNKCRP